MQRPSDSRIAGCFHSISFSCEKRVETASAIMNYYPDVSIQLVSLARREKD